MKYNYTFYNDKKFIGTMVLCGDNVAKDVANGCGATDFENDTTKEHFYKCSVCGKWFKAEDLSAGLCSWCGYLNNLEQFINYCENELNIHWEDKEPLYKEDFTIAFKGTVLKMPFGAIEYNALIDCLKGILKEKWLRFISQPFFLFFCFIK